MVKNLRSGSAAGAPTPGQRQALSVMPRALLGALLRQLRSAYERGRHPARRVAAREQLASLGVVERVLFVCHGNIYRSPFAEAAFRAAVPDRYRDRVIAQSAGFVGPGRPVPMESLERAAARGLDLTSHRSQLLTPALVNDAHLVVVMSQAQQREICRRFATPPRKVLVLGDLDPEAIRFREITDPWNRSPEVLEGSLARVTRCVGEMAAMLYVSETPS